MTVFYFQDDFWEGIAELPRKLQDKAIASLVRYHFTGEEPDFSGPAATPFKLVKSRIDMSKKQALNRSKKQEPNENQNGTKQKPNANQSETKQEPEQNQEQTKEEPNANLYRDRDRDIGKKESPPYGGDKKEKTLTRFSPPSTEQIREYIEEKGFTFDAERFHDFYEANGWMVGKNKMRDWKAAARNWQARESQYPSSKPKKTRKEADLDAGLSEYVSALQNPFA